jgi:hypothetical protein
MFDIIDNIIEFTLFSIFLVSVLLPFGLFFMYCVKNVLLYNSINQTYYDIEKNIIEYDKYKYNYY